MKNYDINLHVQGLSQFIDDIKISGETLHASIFSSPIAHGKIKRLNTKLAEELEGVICIFTYKDIPGNNQIGHIIHDEPLFAETLVEFIGQPIALVIAKTKKIAIKALSYIELDYEELPAILDPREAYKEGNIIGKERVFSCGSIDESWDKCKYVFSGIAESGGQEHLYLETQASLAIPLESNRVKVYSSTQSPSSVQKTISEVLGISLNQIEVEVIRLGGAFGGKEDQANAWAAMAALATRKLNKPVKLILPRHTDMIVTGKRHPYSSDFKIGLSEDLIILAFESTYYQNSGAYADLSTAVLERTMFHITNSYFIPNVKAKGIACKTNLTPNTAFRGFGGPQAMFVIECAIYEAASNLNIPAYKIQQKNLIKKDDFFPYGMKSKNDKALTCWNNATQKFDLDNRIQQIKQFNNNNVFFKKGLAIMPITFGISFTSTFLNQASALVHVYNDGSISVSTGAIEMGQGVNEKIRLTAMHIFSISPDKIRIEATNTTRNANISPTAASSGADLNGNATRIACEEILCRLKSFIPKILGTDENDSYEIRNEIVYHNNTETNLNWDQLILQAYLNRVSLSSQAFYATPDIYFDKNIEKGNPFAYHVNGTAIIETTVDCRLGIFDVESIEVVHDAGNSISPKIDLGQMEGGIVQGIGWITMEEVVHSNNGKLLSSTLSTYKIPDIFAIPKKMTIEFLTHDKEDYGVLRSKAIGEPPFMYGIGVYFSVMNAIKEFNPDIKINYSAPISNEKTLLMLYDKKHP